MAEPADEASTASDFDFWIGSWRQHNRRRREWLTGCDEWDEFPSTSVARRTLDGLGNVDEFRTDYAGGFVGMSIRFFDPTTRTWSIYWADSRRSGLLEPPVIGSFLDDVGIFQCSDTFEGQPILVRYTWSQTRTPIPRWEQAFSTDDGQTWETNWITENTRVDEAA